MCEHMMFVFKAALILFVFEYLTQTQALNALNYYGDSAYPGRCVVDMSKSIVLLNLGEAVKLDSLPCTQIFCMGDGWGMLQTCNYVPPPTDCRYAAFKHWDAGYPKCCKRHIICD
ncbi:uncharacterized protein LOC135429925 [Drosophila montana]|uniref:uncharacterized protein LOC135429925 n=1 Tax=Drosophila montana TaxID=40370 RepID=UPI00313B3F67